MPSRKRRVSHPRRYRMTVCLVTGGAGCIGSHLVEALVEASHLVRVFDNFSTGDATNLDGVRDRIEVREGNLTDLEAVRQATRGDEIIFHQAALASVPRSVANPLTT